MAIIRDTKDLGTFIRRVRKMRGYTQAQLAELAGVGVVYVSHIENGKETAEVGKALRLLQLLSVDLEATDRQNLAKGDAFGDDLPDDEQDVYKNPSVSHENEYLAIPALIGEDGEMHLMGADQAFWHRAKAQEAPALPSEDA